MADVVSKEKRKEMMTGIRGKDTGPEIKIRKALHRKGFRFRLHGKGVPGKPDIILRKYGAVIFVNGCFWHGHDCHLFKWPSTRKAFWKEKITSNKDRDKKNLVTLREHGWRVLVVWECSLKGKTRHDTGSVIDEIECWLRSKNGYHDIEGAK